MLLRRSIIVLLPLFLIFTCSSFFTIQIHADALSLAEDYVTHTWTPKSKNINHTLYTEIGRSSVFTAGTEVAGVAYAWGGYDTISGFDTRISNGEPAGLIYSKNSNGVALTWDTYHKFAGIDCSGFVSRLWNLSTHRSTSELLNYADRIPFWNANQNDIWDKSTHVMWISTATVSGGSASFNGYHSSAKGYVNAFDYNLSYFSSNSYQLYRKGNDPSKPKVEIINSGSEIEISKRSSKTLKYKVSDVYCGEAVIRLLIPDLTAKALNDRSKYYQYPREDLCIEGIKLDKKSDTLYERELEINGTHLATFFSISSTKERYCDGKYEIIFKTRDLNPTVYNSATGTIKFPGDNDFDETKQTIIINNYKPEVHKCTIESKGASGDPAKIDDLVSIKVDFTEEIKEGSNPKIEIEVSPGQFKTLALEGVAWNDNTIGGVKIKSSSFKAQAKMPQHQQSPSSQLEKKLKISDVSGLGTDDLMEPATVTVNGEDIKISADLDYPQLTDGSVVPAETNADEPQQVHVGVNLEDNESGFTPGEQVNINVEGVGTVTGRVDANGTVQANFQSPVVEGTYPISIEIPKDKAGNESKEKKKSLKKPLKVTKKPDSDKHARPVPPDESLDVFGSIITGNKAPRFGVVKVAIFKSGYAVELSDMLATFGEAADYIPPENFSPALASTYPILIIPSAGLANQTNSANLREKLTEYVENGGNLIVMTQPTDECYKLLPDKVESLGYFQDKACYFSTAGIRKYTPALAGQSNVTLDGTADGVIISWPENTETWLYRLKNNFPAMISYRCGNGRVVVSNYYSDYAHGHSQLHQDEKALLRDLLSWGRDFGELPEVKPGGTLQIEVPVSYATGGAEGTVTQVWLILRNPDRKSIVTKEVPQEIAAGETGTVSFDFNDTDQSLSKNALGIWWINYELLDADGQVVQAEREGQRVALSKRLEGVAQNNIAVTVDSPVTTALEGTSIPFRVIARNEEATGRTITLKVYAVLYSLAGTVSEERQVYSEQISVNPQGQAEVTAELLPYKAYTSTGGNSWDKNWWRFVFIDENGKEIITELRGISVYRPAAKVNYKFRNLTNPDAEVFKPGDQIGLDLMIENMVPVGYPVEWEIQVKAKDQNQVIYEQNGRATLDPVITPYQVFTIPEDLQSDTFGVELAVKHNNVVIPLIFGESNISTRQLWNLDLNDYAITSDGLTMDLTNPNTAYTDYTILIKVYDESNKLVLQDYQSGGINGESTLKITTPYNGFVPCNRYVVNGYYMTYPTTSGRWFSHTFEPEQGKLLLTINSVEQAIDCKKLRYHLEIENTGLESSGVQLVAFIKKKNYSQKVSVPNLKTGEKTDLVIEIPLPNGLEQGVYPVEFSFCYVNYSEVSVYKHYPQIKLGNSTISSDGIVCNLVNEGLLNSDFKINYKVFNLSSVVSEGELSGMLEASKTKRVTIPINQFNPFERYLVSGKLICPSSGQEQNIYQWTKPLKVELNTPKEQTITGSKFGYDISLANTGPEFSNLQLTMTFSHPTLHRDFVIPPLATGATCEFKGEMELPGELTPGTYNVTYYLANPNGEKFLLGSGRYTVLAPQIAVNPPAKSEFIPGESCSVSIVNNEDFAVEVGYELQVNYGDQVIATQNGSVNLDPKQESNFAIPIAAGWISSKYYLNWKLTTSPIRTSITGYKAFAVKGMETGLALATDQNIYRTDQGVIAQAMLTNGGYPVNGNLELTVNKLTTSGGGERIDGWPCAGGNNYRTNWAKLKGNIQNPIIRWRSSDSEQEARLIGDMDGDGSNEVIAHSLPRGSKIYILDGSSGHIKAELNLETIFQSTYYYYDITSTLLADINNDGSQELIICIEGQHLLAVNGKAEIVWQKDFTETVLGSQYMTVADLDSDGILELLLDNLEINSQNGAVMRTGSQLGTVADLNNDGKLEIVNKTGIYDHDFNLIAQYQQTFTKDICPVLEDLNHDGYLEIILYDQSGLYVFNKELSLIWFSPIAGIEGVAVGDTNQDGFLETVTAVRIWDSNTNQVFLEFTMLSHQGVVLWQTQTQPDFYNVYGLVLNDYNGDGVQDLIVGSDEGVHIYNTQNGNLTKKLSDYSESLVVGDIDGDCEAEIIGGNICIDDLPVAAEANITAIPPQEVDMWFSVHNSYDWSLGKILSVSNGNYLTVGNGCISYYQASTMTRGIIPLLEVDTAEVILRNNGVAIEVIKQDQNLLLGLINPDSLTYTQKGESISDCEPYAPFTVRNGKQYYLKYEYDDTESLTNVSLWEKDLSLNTKREIGSFGRTYIYNLAVIDENNFFVSNFGNFYKLSLADLSLTEITHMERPVRQLIWVDSQTVILSDDYQRLYKVDLLNNQLVELSSLDDLKSKFFSEVTTDLYWYVSGINSQAAYIVSCDKFDDYNIYNNNIPTPLYKVDFQTNSYSEITKLKEYGREIFSTKREGTNFYFLISTVFNGIYHYDLEKREIVNYPLPAHILEDLVATGCYYDSILAFGPDEKVYLYVDRLDTTLPKACLYSLDPVTGSWSSNLLKAANLLSDLWSDRQDIIFGDQPNCIYLLVTNDYWEYEQSTYLYKYIISSDTLKLLDQIEWTDNISKIVYDKTNNLFYYNFDDNLRSYQNDAVKSLRSFNPDSLFLSGVKENNLYFIQDEYYEDENIYYLHYYDRKHLYENLNIQPTFGLWEYSIDKQKLELFSKVPLKYKAKGVSYDQLQSKLYFFDGWNIYEYPVSKIEIPVSDNDIHENSGLVYQEKTVAQQSFPVSLTAGESKQLEHDFSSFAEPGSYTLKGQLTNSLNQIIATSQSQFVVSDNGLGLSAVGDKQYYRPNENITLSGLLFNTTDIGSGPLKFTITRSLNGQTTVVRDEELILNPGEQRPYTLNLNESTSGEYLFTVKMTQNGTVVAEAKSLITVAEPQVEVEFDPPQVVGSKPVSALIKLTNKSPYPVSIYAVSELLGLADPVTLGANETVLFTKEFSLTSDAMLHLNITGDVTANYQRTIIFNEKADLTVNLSAKVPASARNIPYLLSNTGSVAAEFPVGLTLYRNGAQVAQYNTVINLNPDQSLTGEWPVDLTSGDYRLVYSTLNQTKEINFICLPDYAATMTATSELVGLDELKIELNASNTGCNPILGVINLESEFAKQSIPVEIASGVGYSNVISLTDLPVIAGTYDLKITLEAIGMVLATQSVNLTREETVPPTPELILATIPANLISGAGQEMPVTIKVRNNGDAAGDCIVELSSEAITFSDATVINLPPGAEAEYTFKMIIPEELESGTYQGRIIINETVTHFQYRVNGYKLEAVASLDKTAYLKGETAILTIAVQNKGGQSNLPLTVRVKQGDFDETREITLGTSATLTYQIPVDDFNQKIFYGFYHSGTGRSLLLDIHNIFEATPEFTAVPDKQRYHAGEVVNLNVQVNQEGWLAVAGPNDFYRFEPVDGSRSYVIPLPGDLRTGTYSVWAAFAGKTLEYKIDVIGHDIRFASGELNQTVYQNGEPFQLDTVVTSGEDLNCTALIELVKPDGSVQSIMAREVQLAAGENSLNFKGVVKSEQTGTHRIRVRFQAGDFPFSQNDYSFQFGKEELLSIICSHKEYFNGIEPVSGEIHLYGQGNGNATIYLDGQMITTLAADINGNTVIPYNISASNLKPGPHTLSAVYQGVGGKSGTVTTEFDYGTGLPDLTVSNINVGKERTNDGAIPIAVTVQKGNALPAKEIKVEITLGNKLIGEYLIPELNVDDATDTRTVLWQAGEFCGDAELKVTVNHDNRVLEYDVTNNTIIAKIAIPMVPQVSGWSKLANDPHLPINGQTTPSALVCLYDGQSMIDFGYADPSGNFNLTDHCLNQGENRLRLKARNRDGWESIFTEEFTVILDAAPPQITINNLEDNRHYNYDVLPEITIEESDPAEIQYTLDGQAWVPGTAISAEGAHQLWIMITDIAGNRTERQINFTTDKTPPEVFIADMVDGGYYNAPQAPVVTVNDLNPVITELTLNGEPYQGTAINEDGTYLFEVLAYDQAGNTVTRQMGFTIDRTEPVIQISGVSDGERYSQAVTPVIEVVEANPEEVTILINGQPFVSGTEIIVDGTYELSVTVVDKAGNQGTSNIKFTIDQESGENYTVFCDSLFIRGDIKADQVFCNKLFYYLKGKVNLEYLGITANHLPHKDWMKIEELETGLERQAIPKPDWAKLSKATSQLWPPKLVPGKTYSNIWVNGNLYLSEKLKLTGILVVNGNLTIARNTKLENLAIFCSGKVTVTGNSQMSGLLYAGREIKINGAFKLSGGIITENLTIKGDTELNGCDIGKYEKWFAEQVKKRRKPWWCYWWRYYRW